MTNLRTDLRIIGKPAALFRFWYLPSWNEVFGRGHWRKGQKFTKLWRKKAERMALRWREQNRFPVEKVFYRYDKKGREIGYQAQPVVFTGRSLVVVRVVRGTERRYDVHNVFCKAVFDGFSDAGLWIDDEWPYVPTVLLTWAHDYTNKGQRFDIEIHRMGEMYVNGKALILPDGRAGLTYGEN